MHNKSVHPLFTSAAVFMTFSLFGIRSLNKDCFSWKWISLESMNITKCCLVSLEKPLMQLPSFAACLRVCLFSVCYLTTEKLCCAEIRWLTCLMKNLSCLCLEKLWGHAKWFGSLTICPGKHSLISCGACGWIWEYSAVHFKTHPAACISRHVIIKH